MTAKNLLLILLVGISAVNSANILGIWYHAGKSHHILGEMLFKELARRGHNVTMASPFPLSTPFPNYTDIHLTGILEDQLSRVEMFMKMNQGHALTGADDVLALTRSQTELTLNHTEMHKLIKSGTKFDVIIIDWFLNHAIMIFGKIFNAPIIAISSSGTNSLANYLVGNPTPMSYAPSMLFPFPDQMSFKQRLINGLMHFYLITWGKRNFRYHDKLLEKHFPDIPTTVEELRTQVALVLSNGHYAYESPRPFVPNMIPVGGFHVQKPNKLPHDLQKFMDDAKEGVVYFSLGSNMRSNLLPKEKQQEILRAFAKIPCKVLWKWEEDNLPEQPKNVFIKKWLPQNDILAHPNLKLFITHGGLLSTIESIHFGVPIIGIPIFGDQKANIPKAVSAGYALQVDIEDLSEETLSEALTEILNNPKYAENAKKRSALLKDNPLTPMNTAVFWVEHVIRHKGAAHLKNTGMNQTYFEYLMLDVILFLVTALYLVYKIIKIVVCKLLRCCIGTTPKTKKD